MASSSNHYWHALLPIIPGSGRSVYRIRGRSGVNGEVKGVFVENQGEKKWENIKE